MIQQMMDRMRKTEESVCFYEDRTAGALRIIVRAPRRDCRRRARRRGYSFFALGFLPASPGALKARPLRTSIKRLQIGQVLRASMMMSFISEWIVISLRQ